MLTLDWERRTNNKQKNNVAGVYKPTSLRDPAKKFWKLVASRAVGHIASGMYKTRTWYDRCWVGVPWAAVVGLLGVFVVTDDIYNCYLVHWTDAAAATNVVVSLHTHTRRIPMLHYKLYLSSRMTCSPTSVHPPAATVHGRSSATQFTSSHATVVVFVTVWPDQLTFDLLTSVSMHAERLP